jgi:hypothetical protein
MMTTTILSLALALAPPGAKPEDPTARVLTQLIMVELGESGALEVISDRDVNKVLAIEKQRSVMGCHDADECLAELADAMGARLVVYGDLSRVGERLFLSVNLFDSEESKAVGRILFKGDNLEALETQIGAELNDKLLESRAFPPGARVMVLEITSTGATEAAPQKPPVTEAPPPAEGGIGWIWISSGAALTIVGVAAAAPSVVVPVLIAQEERSFSGGESAALERAAGMHDTWYGDGNLATISAAAGGVIIAAGVGLIVLGVVSE